MHQRQCFSVMSIVGFSTPLRGVADQDVETVEMLAEFGEHLVDAVRNADAGLDRAGAPPERADLGAQRLGLVARCCSS